MSVSLLSDISWTQFAVFFLLFTAIWIVWVCKDRIFSKGPPGNPVAPANTKRVWSVQEQQADSSAGAMGQAPVENSYAGQQDEGQEEEFDQDTDQDENDEFQALEQLVQQITQVITDHKGNTDKAAILQALGSKMQQYPQLNKPPFKSAIHNLIERACIQEAGIVVTEDDTNPLWLQ